MDESAQQLNRISVWSFRCGLAGCSANLARTSVSHACGSTSFILAAMIRPDLFLAFLHFTPNGTTSIK